MSAIPSVPRTSRTARSSAKDRASLCAFTFVDGRRCRTPGYAGESLCFYHARKEAQALASEELAAYIADCFDRSYLTANDLASVIGRLFVAVARGDVKPRAARTLAYLAQTLLQTIQVAEQEYAGAYGGDQWRKAIALSVKARASYAERSSPPSTPPPPPSPAARPPVAPTALDPSPAPSPDFPQPSSHSGGVPAAAAFTPPSSSPSPSPCNGGSAPSPASLDSPTPAAPDPISPQPPFQSPD